jgi:hypothetical protein
MAFFNDNTNFNPMAYHAGNLDGHPEWNMALATKAANTPAFDTLGNWPCDSIQQPAPIRPTNTFARRWRQPPHGLTFDPRPSKESVASVAPYPTQENYYAQQPYHPYPYPGEYLPGAPQLQPTDLLDYDGPPATEAALEVPIHVPATNNCKSLSASHLQEAKYLPTMNSPARLLERQPKRTKRRHILPSESASSIILAQSF